MTDYHRGRIVRLTSDVTQRAERFAQRTGQTVTAVVTAALGEYLDRNEHCEHSDEEEQG